MLNGLVLPTRGTVTVDGLDTRRDGREVRRRVGFCFTDPDAQIVMPTVAEDVALRAAPARPLQGRRSRSGSRAALATYGLDGHADHPAHLLSGGQKQLLALASVLVTEPSVLVMDEPTTLLDLRNARMVAAVVAGCRSRSCWSPTTSTCSTGFDRVLVFDEGPRGRTTGHRPDAVRALPEADGVSPLGLYLPGTSVVHRRPAGAKLLLMLAACVGSVFLDRPWEVASALLVVLGGYTAGARLRSAWRSRRYARCCGWSSSPGRSTCVADGWSRAFVVVGVIAALVLLASLVTLTTRTTDDGRRRGRGLPGRCATSASTPNGSG